MAAAVPDPKFWDMKPWMWPGSIDAVQAQFSKRYVGANVDAALCRMLEDLDNYKGKRGKFTATHL